MRKFAMITLLQISLPLAFTTAGAADYPAATGAKVQTAATAPIESHNYADAYKQTVATGKPLVVLVGASWCPACQSMKTSVLPAVAAQGGLDSVAFAYVNTDQQSDLAGKLMEGGLIPQLVKYEKTDDGWKLKRLVGAQSVSTVKEFVSAASSNQSVAGHSPILEKKAAAVRSDLGTPQASSTRANSSAENHG